MAAYIARRILLIIPTLLGILTLNFIIIQFAPGGPVERAIAQMSGMGNEATMRVSGSDATSQDAATS
ncbi:MAG: microcin ABC transporter permease, partial [Alphaproteobacteria bacterium]